MFYTVNITTHGGGKPFEVREHVTHGKFRVICNTITAEASRSMAAALQLANTHVRMATEFPDYPVKGLPELPPGFAWQPSGNDAFPIAYTLDGNHMIFADFVDRTKSELPDTPRFGFHRLDSDGTISEPLASSDDWADVIAACGKEGL